MKAQVRKNISSQETAKNQLQSLQVSDFRSLDEYMDYCRIEKDYYPAYRQWIIAWLKLSEEEKLRFKLEQ